MNRRVKRLLWLSSPFTGYYKGTRMSSQSLRHNRTWKGSGQRRWHKQGFWQLPHQLNWRGDHQSEDDRQVVGGVDSSE